VLWSKKSNLRIFIIAFKKCQLQCAKFRVITISAYAGKRKEAQMPVNSIMLGERMKHLRSKQDLSQEALAEKVNQSRVNINRIENGERLPSIDILVEIANALHVSTDDLLVDSLEYPISTANSDLHRLLLDCNKVEEQILTKNARELKKILYGLGI